MFIWNINKILDSIRKDAFSEPDKLKYYIITYNIVPSKVLSFIAGK